LIQLNDAFLEDRFQKSSDQHWVLLAKFAEEKHTRTLPHRARVYFFPCDEVNFAMFTQAQLSHEENIAPSVIE
jgi:hypothetical protein